MIEKHEHDDVENIEGQEVPSRVPEILVEIPEFALRAVSRRPDVSLPARNAFDRSFGRNVELPKRFEL